VFFFGQEDLHEWKMAIHMFEENIEFVDSQGKKSGNDVMNSVKGRKNRHDQKHKLNRGMIKESDVHFWLSHDCTSPFLEKKKEIERKIEKIESEKGKDEILRKSIFPIDVDIFTSLVLHKMMLKVCVDDTLEQGAKSIMDDVCGWQGQQNIDDTVELEGPSMDFDVEIIVENQVDVDEIFRVDVLNNFDFEVNDAQDKEIKEDDKERKIEEVSVYKMLEEEWNEKEMNEIEREEIERDEIGSEEIDNDEKVEKEEMDEKEEMEEKEEKEVMERKDEKSEDKEEKDVKSEEKEVKSEEKIEKEEIKFCRVIYGRVDGDGRERGRERDKREKDFSKGV